MRALTLLMIAVVVAACASPSATSAPASPSEAPRESPREIPSDAPSEEPTPSPRPSSWVELAVRGGPAAREDHTWTVADDGRAYLFGGRDGTTVFGDLWAFDLASDAWQELDVGAGPAARFGHEAEWVDGIGLVIFAGQAGTTFFNDLWAFGPDAGSWRQLPSAGEVPPARYGTCAAIGPDGRLWMSHGFTSDFGRFADTRAYDFAAGTWTDETADGDVPVNRCLHGCWWTDAGALALYAGQTTGVTALGDLWSRPVDAAWTEVQAELPAERNLYAYARGDGGTWVFGGLALDGTYLADLFVVDDDLAISAVETEGGAAPPGRAGGELVWDEAGSRLLLFGGLHADGSLADLWELPVAE